VNRPAGEQLVAADVIEVVMRIYDPYRQVVRPQTIVLMSEMPMPVSNRTASADPEIR
jgi:hypothetical protein